MILTAHSGSDGTPNNSLEFIERMIENHVEFIEVDIRRAPNGKLYLSHNPITTNETVDCLLDIEAMFRYIHQKSSSLTVNCDLKEAGLEAEVQWIAEKWELFEQVVFSGTINPTHLSIWDREKILYNIENCLPNIYTVNQLKKAHFDVVNYFCRKYSVHTLNLYYGLCSKEWIELCHANHLNLSVWTVDNLEMIDTFQNQDIYNVTTRRAIEYLMNKGVEKKIGESTKRRKE